MQRRDLLGAMAGVTAGSLLGTAKAEARTFSYYTQINAAELGIVPNIKEDQTTLLQKAIIVASKNKARLVLPAGTYWAIGLQLPDGAQIAAGLSGQVIIRARGKQAIISGKDGNNIYLEGLVFQGAGLKSAEKIPALGSFENCKDLTIDHCQFIQSNGNGLSLQACSGQVTNCQFKTIETTALFANDSTGLLISNNVVDDVGNNGIQVWRSEKGEDGTIVANNHVSNIETRDGGTGQNGNGINIYRAGNVQVLGNHITDCAYTAMRNNAADNCQMVANHCARLGEVAIYAEFGFEGAVIAQNIVDGAWTGISITNFNEGGRLAVCQGNLIRNLRKREGQLATGIAVEADTCVTGNVIENIEGVGISAGYQQYLRDVLISNNLVRRCLVGIGMSGSFEAGFVTVMNNMIMQTKEGAIRAMDGYKPVGKDLSKVSSEAFRHFAIEGNVAR